MSARHSSGSAPIVLVGAAVLILQTRAYASPDGAAWETADDPEACAGCHLGDPARTSTLAADALSLEGVPEAPRAGASYVLTVRLVDDALKNAGFLLRIEAASGAAGRLESVDDRTETDGARARSNWDGSFPPAPGEASWRLIWTAPDAINGELSFEVWANAGNDDLSPLGDRPYSRRWQIPTPP